MVLSLVPMAQAAPETTNVAYWMGIRNQVQANNQTATTTNGVAIPASADKTTITTGDQTKTSNFTYDWNVLSVNAAFGDLHKRAQQFSTDLVARYDVWTAIPVTKDRNSTSNGWLLPNGKEILDTEMSALTNHYLAPHPYSSAVQTAKDFFDFTQITVNGSNLPTDYLRLSRLTIDSGWLVYMLKVGEFDATDVASASADYNIVHRTTSGTNNTKIRVSYTNSGESDKPIKPLYLKPVRKGAEGVYNIYVVNGVVYIDYAQDIAKSGYNYKDTGVTPNTITNYAAIPVGFKFYSDAAATVRVPAADSFAYVVPGKDDTNAGATNGSFFVDGTDSNNNPYDIIYIDYANSFDNRAGAAYTVPSSVNNRLQVKNDADLVLGVWLPQNYGVSKTATNPSGRTSVVSGSNNKTMKVAIEDRDYRYRTGSIKVVFRPLPRNLITTAVIVERYLTIAVGETVELTIESASATTYDNIKLAEINSTKPHVYVDGMKLTGLSVGTAEVQVSASDRVIDQISVNVVATKETVAPEIVNNQWRVLARKLNIRTGPGTSYGKVGTLVMNQVVIGVDNGDGWVKIGEGQYVSKQYVAPVSGSATGIGNYSVSASSLNVRSGPGSSYAKTGSLTRGTVVNVIAIQNGWAQLATGGWVSSMYLI